MSPSRAKTRRLRPAVFIDRDGTLTVRPHLTWRKRQLRLQRGAAKALRILKRLGLPAIVVTNQSVIARGLVSKNGVEKLNELVARRLADSNAQIEAFYFCPHHPQGKVKEYRKNCSCRKPKAGLLRRASRDLGLNLSKSFMIGDMTWDILAGKRAGAKTILVKTGHAGGDGHVSIKPDAVASNLLGAANIIKKEILR